MDSHSNREIDLKDTIITTKMESQVAVEDYEYYYIPEEAKVPAIVHKFQPDNDILFFLGGTKDQERLIYPNNGPWEEKENEVYDSFCDYCEKNEVDLPVKLSKSETLRFLYGNHFKNKDTVTNINDHYAYKREISPIILNEDMKKLIDNGLIYMHGRDKCFRPIVVFKSGSFTEVGSSLEDALQATYFVSWMIIDHCMLQGKVENWVLVDDFDNLSMWKLPNKFIKDFMDSTQKHLKCRGTAFIALNVTFGLRALWKILSPFVDTKVKRKVVLASGSTHENLTNCAHPSQIEQKYGGEADDITTYRPLICPSSEFGHDEDLISR